MFRPEMSEVKRYNELLDSLNLKQMVSEATRIAKTSKTLIHHIITNTPKCITYTEVLPCPLVSNHDAPYVCVNAWITRYTPRHKFIRNDKQFSETAFIDDFAVLPFEIVYAFDDPNDKIATFNRLVTDCLDRHAPLKKTKVIRPSAPWLNDPSIHPLQVDLANQHLEAYARSPKKGAWDMFRHTRNKLKKVIKKAKRSFMITALSSKQRKEVWRTIHLILYPSQLPLRVDPDDLNRHFASTAERVTASSPVLNEDIYRLINGLTDDSHSSFRFRHVTHQEVLREIKGLRSDCSNGRYNIPAKFVKLVAEYLASPLTHIINSCLNRNEYPLLWKTACISPIPKVG